MVENVLTNPIFSKILLPFVLIFVVVYALLEKTKVLGDDNKQINAMVAAVIGIIFIAFAFPKDLVTHMMLFLAVALVIFFVFLLIFGFAAGGSEGLDALTSSKGWKWFAGIVIGLALIIFILWTSGVFSSDIFDWLFESGWSETFWMNVIIIFVIAAVVAVVLWKGGSSSGGKSDT